MDHARGNFIDNQWVMPTGDTFIRSINPATADEVVLTAPTSTEHVALAVAAAQAAWPEWAATPASERIAALRRFARELAPRTESLARAISAEMGKAVAEARIEAKSLIARIDMVAEHQMPQVRSWSAPGVAGECRYHPLGVIAVLGPYNFPLHLVHAHVIPALATGNTVVIKASERAPLSVQRYVEAWEAAGLPPILQMVQGGPDVGRALTATEGIRGVAFTGSWRAGHAIETALIERPEVLVALEMGGQNMAIVMDDADLDQALEGVLLGGFLTTGQRCTCTNRVLVHKAVADTFIQRLVKATKRLTWGDPSGDVFMGPLASTADRDRVDALVAAGVDAGAEVLLAAETRPGGAWRGPSIHRIAADHDSDYTRDEVFGPDLAVTIVDDLDQAVDIVNSSDYGLSGSIFSASRANFEDVYLRTRLGCLNWNRSTNRASGAMPFGGVGKSGNFRPAGSDAVRYTTFPVQVQWNTPGVLEGNPFVRKALAGSEPIAALEARHSIEEACEPYGIYPDIDIESGTVRIGSAQLDGHGVALSAPLIEALKDRGAAASTDDTGVRIVLPAGSVGSRQAAMLLSDALWSIRHHHPARFLGRRPAGCHVPAGDGLSLPRSAGYMARLIEGDFIPNDKKPTVIDLHRSAGPYLASIDEDPLVIFDAASQIATHAAGLNAPAVVEALVTGRFGITPIDNGSPATTGRDSQARPELTRLAAVLRGAAGAHPYVRFCNSGAEANEIALSVCAKLRPGKKRLVAFKGGFHGRTMLALHATWNPSKRERFELDGYQAHWIDWPFWPTPGTPVSEPAGWLDGWSQRDGARSFDAGDDPLVAEEIRCLLQLEDALKQDDGLALICEPMQSEGGERYATPRFFRAVRALTTAYGMPLIMDEVQTGFNLGGPFFWHTRFNLPTPPDVISCAKKCQVGAVVSRYPVEVRSEVQVASAIRGTLYAELLAEADPEALLNDVHKRLETLAAAHPTTCIAPRATGYCFGFDLPDPKSVAFVIGQRLWRGYMLYGAGSTALRFRLHNEMDTDAIAALFDRLDASLTDLESQPEDGTAWRVGATDALPDRAPQWPSAPVKLSSGFQIVKIDRTLWPDIRDAYESLQRATYEPARQDDFDHFSALMEDPDAICFVAIKGTGLPPKGTIVGACIAFPLSHFATLDGPRQDPSLGRGATLYSGDLTVAVDFRGHGLGRALKQAQVSAAMQATRADGTPRFDFLVGRNRVGATQKMERLNVMYGASRVARYSGQYGEADAQSQYYRVTLSTPRLPGAAQVLPGPKPRVLDLDPGITQRLGDVSRGLDAHQELLDGLHEGRMNGGIVNKLSLCNFVTPNIVRAFEMLRALAPKQLGHLIPASGRAEMLDKALRGFKFHRGRGDVVLSLGPVDAGSSTSAARSVTLPADDPANLFGWPTLPDPTLGPAGCLAALRKNLSGPDQGGYDPERILAVILEPVSRATGRAVPSSFWAPLRALCDEFNVPLVIIENTTAGYRGGRGMWRADTLDVAVDAVLWHPGGQTGLAFVNDRYYVPNKLTLISTWDGDELALTRLIWSLRAVRGLPIRQRGEALAEALAPLGTVNGEGLYRTVETQNAEMIQRRLGARGIHLGRTVSGALRAAPALNVTSAEIAQLAQAIRELQ